MPLSTGVSVGSILQVCTFTMMKGANEETHRPCGSLEAAGALAQTGRQVCDLNDLKSVEEWTGEK